MFYAGIYCRVSVEETDKEGEYSNSIHSQIKIAEDYVSNQQDVTVVERYIDDGISGSHFDRMEFRRMLADIELGKINMVIFKDSSRLGREHIDTNYYLGKYFPERGIRVLSLLDYYDSQVSLYDEMMDIKTLMNDMYLRDTSKKIKSVIRMKRSMREYTSKEAPYGYIKSKVVSNHLEIDPYAAKVVQRIYQMYLSGCGCTIISRILNEDEILCPSRYKKEVLRINYPYSVGRGLWTESSVNNILKNPVYIGAIVLKKMEKPSYKLKYRKVIRLEERELCENSHKAIISKEQFEQVQQIRNSKRIPYFNNSAPIHKYSGLLYCGKCGYSMRKRYLISRSGYDGYICGSHQEMGQNYCELNHITFEKLDELVAFTINQQIKNLNIEWRQLKKYIGEKNDIFVKRMDNLQAKMEKNRSYCKRAYEQYMDEALTKEEYLDLKTLHDVENNQYQTELKELEQNMKKEQRTMIETEKWLSTLKDKRMMKKQLTREVLAELIERIEVYPSQQLDIKVRFNNQ